MFEIDQEFIKNFFREIVEIPSPVGYHLKLNPVLEQYAEQFGYEVTYDNRGTPYITVDGTDHSKTVLIGAHADTLGAMIRRIDNDGSIRIRPLGGLNYNSAEGESVTVYTRDGRGYTGLMTCQSHSIHGFADARTLTRNEDTMIVLLDENVHSKADVMKLGIRNGDYICLDPHCEITENGYIKSRFIDDKGAVAASFAALKYLSENHLKPKYRTIFAFPYREEIGQGGTFVPAEVSEYVAVDIGLIGPDFDGNEYDVSICAKDVDGPYDFELTSRLVDYAKKAGCGYQVDIYYKYSTDGNAAMKGGNDLRSASCGMAVYCSHGRERTHISGITNTAKLILAYSMDI